ncbi:helix-turn-helix transcriptional regulator [Crassaminicella thermophila]|uniref:Helix-turn-helix transcriptional regulator n=1 Tax=Crassaminicella thermophila TaxID=2599308 RepID=A0A5C0SI47_CRATE|nr:helix-turn-helix transcriptional regulator [Crassaminicella thermophila]QEK12619.1 helix-turn-helix transcriptional regulator [Crassaminicella thermophila]
MRNIGERIKHFRNKQGITQVKLSEITSIEQTVISRYENGVIVPPIPKLEKIAKALKIPLTELLKDQSA